MHEASAIDVRGYVVGWTYVDVDYNSQQGKSIDAPVWDTLGYLAQLHFEPDGSQLLLAGDMSQRPTTEIAELINVRQL